MTRKVNVNYDVEKLEDTINKTGFPMEYTVQKILENHGWSVVSNKFYVDDIKKIEREIDLVATKRIVKDEILCEVNLIISCKKSESGWWVFLTSNHRGNNNYPIRYITDVAMVDYALENEPNLIQNSLGENMKKVMNADSDIRAYLQINKNSYKDEGNKHIYDSILTTIKAENYENYYRVKYDKSLKQYFICYHLLSVFDGKMIEKNLETNIIHEVDELNYMNRHIISEEDRLYRVHFIKLDVFDNILTEYDRVVSETAKLCIDVQNKLYQNIFYEENRKYVMVCWDDFCQEFWESVAKQYNYSNDVLDNVEKNYTGMDYFFSKNKKLHIKLNLFLYTNTGKKGIINELNENKFCQDLMKMLLKKYYKYEGKFIFEIDKEAESEFA